MSKALLGQYSFDVRDNRTVSLAYISFTSSGSRAVIRAPRGRPLTKFLFTNTLSMSLSNNFETTDVVCFHSSLCQQTPQHELGCRDKNLSQIHNFSGEKGP